jgi:hypothetical protein
MPERSRADAVTDAMTSAGTQGWTTLCEPPIRDRQRIPCAGRPFGGDAGYSTLMSWLMFAYGKYSECCG